VYHKYYTYILHHTINHVKYTPYMACLSHKLSQWNTIVITFVNNLASSRPNTRKLRPTSPS